jgi:hypothetical protein
MNELTVLQTNYNSVEKLIKTMPGMDYITLRYCLNTGKQLRKDAKTRDDQDKATKLMIEATAYLNKKERTK